MIERRWDDSTANNNIRVIQLRTNTLRNEEYL